MNGIQIVFVMGTKSFTIDPADENELGGGAEKAVIRLSQALAKLNSVYSVVVCGPVETKKFNGVLYLNFRDFLESRVSFVPGKNTVGIVWRNNGHIFIRHFIGLFKGISHWYLDLHDFMANSPEYVNTVLDRTINYKCALVKSLFHYNQNVGLLRDLPMAIIPNGVETKKCYQHHSRSPYRLCHATSLDRGLVEMLEISWPLIKARVPEAEFHVYYGRLNFIHDLQLRTRVEKALKQNGVFFHSRVKQSDIMAELQQSSFYFYLSNNEIHEADCLAVREAVMMGCLPILLDWGVFRERFGLKIKPSQNQYKVAAEKIVDLMQNTKEMNSWRTQMATQPIYDWDWVAKHWLKLITQ